MKIIGHRGAAGLTLENTLSSFELAKLLGLEAVELDVRLTKDGKLVVCHDADLERISPSTKKISDLTYKQLQKIVLYDLSSTVPLLSDALKLLAPAQVVIELKDSGSARPLLDVLSRLPKSNVIVASFKLEELTLLRSLAPEMRLYGLERTKPFDIIHLAKLLRLDGIGLNFWLLNPLTYWLAKRAKLEIFVYTVNNRLLGKFLGMFYPDAAICTDHPEWFIKHEQLLKRREAPWHLLYPPVPQQLIKKRGKKRAR